MKRLYELTVKEALELLESKEITARELVQSCLDRIEEMEPTIHAFLLIIKEEALKAADQIDMKRTKGEPLGKLAGIPYSLKDVYSTKGYTTTAGSKMLEGYIAPYNATVVEKLAKEDAILIGKTNCDPFGFGSSTENSAYGVTRNPLDTDRVPGGSSGGSGAAVAYGGGLFSIGEDTGGSIRCPAAFCGIVGLKPTYGRVSRYGSIAYASSYDTVGPMTKDIYDNALILSVIAGKDTRDATTSAEKVKPYHQALDLSLKGRKVGVVKEYLGDGVDEEVKKAINQAIEVYKSLGCEIVEVSLPYTEYAIAAYYVIGISEASSNLARMDGIRFGHEANVDDWKDKIIKTRGEGFGPEEKRRVMVGTYALSTGYADKYYHKAQQVRAILKDDILKAFKKVDILLTPTMPVLPPKIGENTDDPLKMWLMDAFTVTINPVGVPALALPAGNTKDGLSVGMQLIGPHFKEDTLYNFAYLYEKSIKDTLN
ncbi:MAG: Glutamyl-tRNA(Gln) amidotransferase subunit A [candidate division WS6 bacterium GW2011_GWF2_39_15]|uniref:Glutamyl-tRNA(Gln) amidotransferase subunit A n=1 Tax=candidate division WS6 bacterium GW2011_GWF2_39_15 TaxID=1619100 RepID=A0A0G0MPQ8_9BACT|nr:MAG: Glutamyl-tRNA(Gln) amidotransferase subunit A [candidate division WS6 bacterium GW2011_GWF2_39_15]